jgi:hypothetical protein
VIYGGVKLQSFCKEEKLQLHILKKHKNYIITKDMVIGNKIYAKNTIGWTLKN